MFEVWREWLLAAVEWRYVVCLLCLLGLWVASDTAYEIYQDGKEVVEEVIHPGMEEHTVADTVTTKEVGVVYTVDQEVGRVMRI